MDDKTSRAVDRMLKSVSRPRKRGGNSWISMPPIMLCLGLFVGYQLTAHLVPAVWSQNLPGGLRQAYFLRGWPGLVWTMAVHCHDNFPVVLSILVGTGLFGFLLSALARPLRPIVWLMAIATIAINAGIIYVTMRTAIEAMAGQL